MMVITLAGAFSDEDLVDLTALLRRIDERHPEQPISMSVLDPASTMAEALQRMEAMLPHRDGQATKIRSLKA